MFIESQAEMNGRAGGARCFAPTEHVGLLRSGFYKTFGRYGTFKEGNGSRRQRFINHRPAAVTVDSPERT
jgi:hypothetical protein